MLGERYFRSFETHFSKALSDEASAKQLMNENLDLAERTIAEVRSTVSVLKEGL